MGELETKYLSVRRHHRPRPLRDKPTAAIHSDVPISMSMRPGRLQLYWRGSLPLSEAARATDTALPLIVRDKQSSGAENAPTNGSDRR